MQLVFGGRGGTVIHGEVWRERWFATSCNHGSRESVWLMRHRVEGQHDSRHYINPHFGRWSLEQASAEHVVEGPMAPFINGVALRMVGGSENLLDPEGAQQLCPDTLMNSGPRLERSRRGVPKYGITWRMRALLTVLAVWLMEGMRIVYLEQQSTKTIMAVVRRQRSHNANGQRIPGGP